MSLKILHAAASQPGIIVDDRKFVFNEPLYNANLDEITKLIGGRLLAFDENGANLADGVSTSTKPPLGFIIGSASGEFNYFNKPAIASKLVPFCPLTNGTVIETDQFKSGIYDQGHHVFCGTGDDVGFVVDSVGTAAAAATVTLSGATVTLSRKGRFGNAYRITTQQDTSLGTGENEIEIDGFVIKLTSDSATVAIADVNSLLESLDVVTSSTGGTGNVAFGSDVATVGTFTGGADGGSSVGIIEGQSNSDVLRIHCLGA